MTDYSRAANVTVSALTGAAEDKSGVSADGGSYVDGLALVCEGLRSGEVRPGGRAMLADEAINYLTNRLLVDAYHADHPALAGTEVEAPVVILGLPRTGTTVLSYLLDCDPRCLDLLAFQEAVFPTLDPPPPHWEWAYGPTECTFLLAQDFKAIMWETRGSVGAEDAGPRLLHRRAAHHLPRGPHHLGSP